MFLTDDFTKTRLITHAALIAAVYAALTIWLAPISFGPQQIRVAEALAILPAFTPAAVPGLFIGCLVANTVSFMGVPDLIFGSLATLVSAQLTYMIAKALKERAIWLRIVLLPLPAVLVNAVVIGAMLAVLVDMPFAAAAISVLAGQALSCYGLGAPLYLTLRGLIRPDVACGEICHGEPPRTSAVAGSPSVAVYHPLQRCLSRPVRVPERFRGCCPFGARG